MERRKFSREFKLEAVNLVRDRGVAIVQAARDLDINHNMLRRWLKEHDGDPKYAFPGLGRQLEIDRLRQEVARLKAERDILKKAAYFAKDAK
jgi:transposase